MTRRLRVLATVVAALLAFTLPAPAIAGAQEADEPSGPRYEVDWSYELPPIAELDVEQLRLWLSQLPQLTEQDLHDAFTQGQQAIDKLGDRLPAVAQAYGLHATELYEMLSRDLTLFVDDADELVYFDVLAPEDGHGYEQSTAASPEAVTAAAALSGFEFALESNPGAAKTIFLDFDGHTTQGTSWNSQQQIAVINSPAYDIDGDPNNWSPSELDTIARSWASVAEDFAPWNVNVTTIDPGPEALRNSGFGDNEWGVRVLITTDTLFNCGCGGVGYIGAFDDRTDEPVFVFNTSFAGISETITHEVGHAMLLAHDGSTAGTYYSGHGGTNSPSWGPIMGASFYKTNTQWSQQEFFGANNNTTDANFGYGRDDIAIISSLTNGNNFGLKVDDHGDTIYDATTLEAGSSVTGLIETRHDRDTFAFTTLGGTADFSAAPAAISPNLDIELTLRDSDGLVVATSNPAMALDASLSAQLPAGNYTVEIDGVGSGAPDSIAPSGYSDYGSIGAYTLTATISDDDIAQTATGDVNCDGQSTATDALLIAQYSVGNRTNSECPLQDPATQIYAPAADVNGDGNINVGDALLISQCSVGLPNEFCP